MKYAGKKQGHGYDPAFARRLCKSRHWPGDLQAVPGGRARSLKTESVEATHCDALHLDYLNTMIQKKWYRGFREKIVLKREP